MHNEGQSSASWRKSSRSVSSNCVEVAVTDSTTLVRDSKNPAGGILEFESSAWSRFITGIQQGRDSLLK
jgi:hypothetical protein